METAQPSNAEVLSALFTGMPDDERAVLCSIGGDPGLEERWPGIAWRHGSRCPVKDDRNNYVAISGFRANERGEWRRRKDQFAGLYVVMIDDIGTKIDVAAIPRGLRPTLVVETSPGNFQATFKLTEPVRDIDAANDLIGGAIAKLTHDGVDPGMAGVTRVFRLPGGINGKPKYERDGAVWRCKVHRWKPEVTTTFEDFARAVDMVRTYRSFVEPNDAVTVERKRGFEIVMAAARQLGIVKRGNRGWADVRCPWLSEHTDRSDSGSAIAYPARANGYVGGYRCHHGHCQGRGWADIEEWLSNELLKHGRATRGPFRT